MSKLSPHSYFNFWFNSALIFHSLTITVNYLSLSSVICWAVPMSHCNLSCPHCHNTPLTLAFLSMIEKRVQVTHRQTLFFAYIYEENPQICLTHAWAFESPHNLSWGAWEVAYVGGFGNITVFILFNENLEFYAPSKEHRIWRVIEQYSSVYENSCRSSALE